MSRFDAEVAIVGGGLIGCMTAHELRKRGRSVIVLERGLVGCQSSGVSFGSLRLQGQHEPELPLALRSQELWEGVEAQIGESVEFARHGHVHLAIEEDQEARLEASAVHARACGLPIERFGRQDTTRRWPFLSANVRASSWSPRDAVANPRLVAPAFARAAKRLGALIREGIDVVAVEAGADGFAIHCRDRVGAKSTIRAEVLVNAGGAWGGTLAAWFGETIPLFAAGPAEMVTGPVPLFVEPTMHVVDGSVLFRQTTRGNVVIGGHPRMSVDAAAQRTRVPGDKILTNLARLVAIAPHLRAYAVIRSWSGIEGYVEDMMPVLGPSATTPGLFHACAFSGHGLQLGPAAATALAELITTGATGMPIAPFGIGRFSAGTRRQVHSLAEEFQDDVLRRSPNS